MHVFSLEIHFQSLKKYISYLKYFANVSFRYILTSFLAKKKERRQSYSPKCVTGKTLQFIFLIKVSGKIKDNGKCVKA